MKHLNSKYLKEMAGSTLVLNKHGIIQFINEADAKNVGTLSGI